MKNGKVKVFYDNGRLEFEGEYLNGRRWYGKIKSYYYNGNLSFEGDYLNGERNGKRKEYLNEEGKENYDNDNLKSAGEILNEIEIEINKKSKKM